MANAEQRAQWPEHLVSQYTDGKPLPPAGKERALMAKPCRKGAETACHRVRKVLHKHMAQPLLKSRQVPEKRHQFYAN